MSKLNPDAERWNKLPQPFKPGTVIPFENGTWVFTFRDGNDDLHVNRDSVFNFAPTAKRAMRDFCNLHQGGNW